MRSPTLEAYVTATAIGSLAATAALPATGLLDDASALLALVALAALVGARTVRIPKLRIRVSASDLFVFCALVTLVPLAVPLVALASVAGGLFGPERRPLSLRTVFNLAAVPLSAAAAAGAMLALGGSARGALLVLPLLGAGVTYFVVNIMLVAVAVQLEQGRGFGVMWTRCAPWALVSCAASLVLGAGLLLVLQDMGPLGLAIGVVPATPIAAYHQRRKQKSVA